MIKMEMVVPTTDKDVKILLQNMSYYFKYLPISSICVIGDINVEKMLPKDQNIKFVNENALVDCKYIRKCFDENCNFGNSNGITTAGWYIQQFIKMEFSRYCNEEYYLIWDSDTIPLKQIDMFDNNGIPYFDCKNEYHKLYFDTLNSLLPYCHKVNKKSFISEHMVIKTEFMRRLIYEIEKNQEIDGKNYQEKIMQVLKQNIFKAGFSEFETYGTFVSIMFPQSYNIREWSSMRYGGYFFCNENKLEDRQIKWLSKKYDAVSIEKHCKLSLFSNIVNNLLFENIFDPMILEYLSYICRIKSRAIKAIRKVQKS